MEFRSIDGSGNRLDDPSLNQAGEAFARLGPARYADGIGAMVGGPNPRSISNIVVGEGEAATPNAQGLSGMMYAWGQFIDHDLTRTPSDRVTDISVVDPSNPLAPVNAVTTWLDASMVYGSDAATASALRAPGGKMLTSDGGNLPIVNGMYMAGDIRVAENPALTALQTLFVREHNWQVDRLQAADPTLTDEALYQQARAIVTAEIAHITYEEFLPKLVGADAIAAYAGYDATVDPRLSVEFAVAAYRWGHSTVSAETERKDETGELAGPGLDLRDAFFMAPAAFAADGGADGFLRHLGTDRAQAMDARIVEDLRSFLVDFDVGQDLAALNIQRGRDAGLGTLNGTRIALGLDAYTAFEQITDDAATVEALRQAYGGNVDAIELWTGGLSERLVPGTFLGETFGRIVADQFAALRDGDRLFYLNQGFDAATLAAIQRTSLADIVRRNTDTDFLQDDMFVFFERRAADVAPEPPDAGIPEPPQLVIGTGDGQTLEGGALGDLLAGRQGAQVLMGGTGDDLLKAGAGDDILIGGEGADTLRGGQGRDVFRFDAAGDSAAAAPDRIRDFTAGEDLIDVSAIAAFAWRGAEAFTAAGVAEARFQGTAGGDRVALLLDADGDGTAESTIIVNGVASLGTADLLL
jgi:Ca2+-binding RTX toxin-like protein